MYAATPDGVFRSTDHAQTWHVVGLLHHEVLKVTQYQVPGQEVLFAIVRDGNTWTAYRSGDSALTWDSVFSSGRSIPELLQNGSDIITAIAGLPFDPKAGIYRSTDVGESWKRIASLAPNNLLSDFTVGANHVFAIEYDSGVWELPIGDTLWQKTSYPAWHRAISIRFFGSELFVGGWGRLDISIDTGRTWLNVPNFGLDTNTDFLSSFAVDGLNIIATGPEVFRSTDGASSWHAIEGTNGYPRDGSSNDVAFNDHRFFSGDNAGVVASADGVQWNYATEGLPAEIRDVFASDSLLFALTPRGVFHSSDHGSTWSVPTGGTDLEDSLASKFTFANGTLFASGSPANDDHAGLWQWNGSAWATVTDLPVISIAGDTGTLLAALDLDGAVTSTDHGETWNPDQGLPLDTALTETFAVLPGTVLAFVAGNSPLSKGIRVFASNDEGLSWNLLDTVPAIGEALSSVAVGDTVYLCSGFAGVDGAISISTDGGLSWQTHVEHAMEVESLDRQIVVTTTDSIYEAGPVHSVLMTDSISTLLRAFTADRQFAYAGSTSRGVWAAPIANFPLGVHQNVQTSPALHLSIYPNPSRGSGYVIFALPRHEALSLSLFDERGGLIREIYEGVQGPGNVSIPFSLDGIADGIYTLRLKTEEGISSTQLSIEEP